MRAPHFAISKRASRCTSPFADAAVIINPIAGGGRPGRGAARAELAAAVAEGCGTPVEVFVTERSGHARELARAAVGRGAGRVIVWGGDGTVNEVASALAFGGVPMGIVPAGSGNGLAWALGLPAEPARALNRALAGAARAIDAGEIEGRLFVNVAGVGFDAAVAARFAAPSNTRRGLSAYVWLTARTLLDYRTCDYTITADGASLRTRALLVTLANGPEFGNRTRIAPSAKVDDGRLDVVVVEERSRLDTLGQLPYLFAGRIERSRLWSSRQAAEVTVEGDRPLAFHVDGEPAQGGTTLTARIRPGALRVIC
jgi:diacylglycerol kinase (ATP)